jgi:hypothetical protein
MKLQLSRGMGESSSVKACIPSSLRMTIVAASRLPVHLGVFSAAMLIIQQGVLMSISMIIYELSGGTE